MGKQNNKLLKNIKLYEKKKAKQQESKVSGSNREQRQDSRKKNINVHYTK